MSRAGRDGGPSRPGIIVGVILAPDMPATALRDTRLAPACRVPNLHPPAAGVKQQFGEAAAGGSVEMARRSNPQGSAPSPQEQGALQPRLRHARTLGAAQGRTEIWRLRPSPRTAARLAGRSAIRGSRPDQRPNPPPPAPPL